MTDLSLNGVQTTATQVNGPRAAARPKEQSTGPLFQAQTGDFQNIKGTTSYTEGQKVVSKTTFNDGSYKIQYPDGRYRVYSSEDKWVGGQDKRGLEYTNTYTQDGCTCSYSDGSAEFYDADNKVLKGVRDTDGSERYFANGNSTYVVSGRTSDADGNRSYTITRETANNGKSNYETQQFDDGQKIVTKKDSFGQFKSETTYNTDGTSVTRFPKGSLAYKNQEGILTGGRTSNGVEYTHEYSGEKLIRTTYANGEVRTYSEDSIDITLDQEGNWTGGESESLGKYRVKAGENGEYILTNENGVSITYGKDGKPIPGQE